MNLRFYYKERVLCHVRNEKGFALVTVLVLSAVLMATMTIIMNTSTFETAMSGASTFSKRALARADAGIEYVRGAFKLVNYHDSVRPFDSPGDPAEPDYLPIRNEYIQDEANVTYAGDTTNAGATTNLMDDSNVGFNLRVSRKTDNSLLTGRGFGAGFSSGSGSGGGMRLQAYPCRIESTGRVAQYSKTVRVEGFNLAP